MLKQKPRLNRIIKSLKKTCQKTGIFMIAISSVSAFADEMPWDSPLKKIGSNLTGSTAHYMVVIAIAASGLGFAIGEHGGWMRKAMAIVFGASIAIGAYQIAQSFGWA